MPECASCGWVGADVELVSFIDGEELWCVACRVAGAIFLEGSKTVGKMRPASLVPLIRACVSQSVGAIVAHTLLQLSESVGADEFESLIKALKSGSIPQTDLN